MRILVVTPYYAPDLGPSAPLFSMLCEDLVSLKHEVTVLAAVPHFPSGHVDSKYRKRAWNKEICNGVKIYRAWVPSGDRASLRHRLQVFIAYQLITTIIGLKLSYDAVIISNPAIETGVPFVLLSWIRRKPTLLCVWDIYPEVGIDLGIFRHRAIIASVKTMEDFCLQRSAAIQVFSASFVKALAAHGVEKEKIVVIPPWIDTDFIQPLPHQNLFSKEYDLQRHFIVLYAGNLGKSQGLDKILLVAKALSSQRDIMFVFVGEGINREALSSQAEELGLINVKFIPFQPHERLPEVLASADIALICQQSGLENDSFPSKTFPILASGRPIIAVIDNNSPLSSLIKRSQAGYCVPPGDIEAASKAILFLKSAPEVRQAMSLNARKYAVENHSRLPTAYKFDKLIGWMVKKTN